MTSNFLFKISIILPSYNRAKYLSQTIESCLTQTFTDFELIIIDDCSTDNSLEVARDYASQDNRIRIIENKTNKKLPATLNIGFKKAKGQYLTWISDDNLYHKDALEKMSKYLDDREDIGLVYTDYTLINEKNEIGSRIYQEPPEFLPIRDCVGACFLYRANLARQVGEYSEKMFLVEDYEYWLRLGLITKFFHLKESLYFYRVHPTSLTEERKEEIRIAKKTLKKIFQGKYVIPEKNKPIYDLYMWFIEDKNFKTYIKLVKIIICHPITTVSYIVKNIRRLR
ncbi:MAG: glycosyltransferase family 2 protein [Rickettsia endosymbiont of Oxypoda opaca]|nr:glycosyltransferase family 2 protein [Rickettsia endosymbiont of Oxypoda opaca]